MIQNMKGTLSEDELETLRKRAWREQGILIVSPYDDRLQFFDRTRLCEIGNRFYGQNRPKKKT
jgi:hypothetical protein